MHKGANILEFRSAHVGSNPINTGTSPLPARGTYIAISISREPQSRSRMAPERTDSLQGENNDDPSIQIIRNHRIYSSGAGNNDLWRSPDNYGCDQCR